jgi:hypothetical protein
MRCQLCEREMEELTLHHLIPKQYTKRKRLSTSATIDICSPCHRQIHALFDNKSLAKELNTIEALTNEPRMHKFIGWVSKQTANKSVTVYHQR